MTNSFPRTSFFTCRKACWIRYKNERIFPRIGRCQYLRKTQSTIYVVPMTNGQWHTKTMIARQELIWITNDSEQIESRLACHLKAQILLFNLFVWQRNKNRLNFFKGQLIYGRWIHERDNNQKMRFVSRSRDFNTVLSIQTVRLNSCYELLWVVKLIVTIFK